MNCGNKIEKRLEKEIKEAIKKKVKISKKKKNYENKIHKLINK